VVAVGFLAACGVGENDVNCPQDCKPFGKEDFIWGFVAVFVLLLVLLANHVRVLLKKRRRKTTQLPPSDLRFERKPEIVKIPKRKRVSWFSSLFRPKQKPDTLDQINERLAEVNVQQQGIKKVIKEVIIPPKPIKKPKKKTPGLFSQLFKPKKVKSVPKPLPPPVKKKEEPKKKAGEGFFSKLFKPKKKLPTKHPLPPPKPAKKIEKRTKPKESWFSSLFKQKPKKPSFDQINESLKDINSQYYKSSHEPLPPPKQPKKQPLPPPKPTIPPPKKKEGLLSNFFKPKKKLPKKQPIPPPKPIKKIEKQTKPKKKAGEGFFSKLFKAKPKKPSFDQINEKLKDNNSQYSKSGEPSPPPKQPKKQPLPPPKPTIPPPKKKDGWFSTLFKPKKNKPEIKKPKPIIQQKPAPKQKKKAEEGFFSKLFKQKKKEESLDDINRKLEELGKRLGKNK